jgi:hypothetical protein
MGLSVDSNDDTVQEEEILSAERVESVMEQVD